MGWLSNVRGNKTIPLGALFDGAIAYNVTNSYIVLLMSNKKYPTESDHITGLDFRPCRYVTDLWALGQLPRDGIGSCFCEVSTRVTKVLIQIQARILFTLDSCGKPWGLRVVFCRHAGA